MGIRDYLELEYAEVKSAWISCCHHLLFSTLLLESLNCLLQKGLATAHKIVFSISNSMFGYVGVPPHQHNV